MVKVFFKKGIVLLLSMVLLMSATGCSVSEKRKEEEGEPVNESASQVYVGVWDGGYGASWCESAARKFEEIYANESFEEGKKGVQVHVEKSKSYAQDRCASTLNSATHDIIFTEQANYYEFVRLKTAYDITEWLNTPLNEYGENKSIIDKMSSLDRDYYGVGKDNSNYYAVPWYASFSSFNYDVDLFEENNLYFAKSGEGDEKGFVFGPDTPKSKGPDGKTGVIDGIDYSADDGLPATFDEFFQLCDYMVEIGIVPVIWSGFVQTYVNSLAMALVADIEGYDDMNMNYTLEGDATKLVKRIENGILSYEQKTAINDDNGYMLKQHEGYYYALKFLHRLLTTEDGNGHKKYYNETDCFSQSVSQVGAQAKFLQSKYSTSSKPIAMLIDGTWWYNEATSIFNQMGNRPGAGQYERRIGILSFPKVDETRLGEPNYLLTWSTSVVVRGSLEENKKNAVRAFYRYLHTDESLSSFTVEANGIRPFDFTLKGVDKNDMSYFAAQQYDIMHTKKFVVPYSENAVIQAHLNRLYASESAFNSLIGNNSYSLITTAFGVEGISVEDYFNGLVKYLSAERWKNL